MRKIGKLCFMVGCLLVAGSFMLFLSVRLTVARAQTRNAAVVERICNYLPPLQPGVQENYSNMTMPLLEIDGSDYVALLDIPALGLTLPVADKWDKGRIIAGPRRFEGTAYDGSLVVGGADQPGQFSGFASLQPGSSILVTDMTGLTFHYVIDRIDRSSLASKEILTGGNTDLTLFVRNAYGLNYLILRCVAK